MKESTLNNIEHIIEYMNVTGWTKTVEQFGPNEKELKSYCADISKKFIDLSVSSVGVLEAKYYGYVELLSNKDKPELHDSILKKHALIVQEKERERQEIELGLSELIFLLEDLRERTIALSNLPQSVPCDNKSENVPDKNCA